MINKFNNTFIYKKYLIILLFIFAILIPQNLYAQCNKEGITVVYVNGIFTPTKKLADADRNALRDAYKDTFDISNIKFITGYNPSHLAGLGDLIESASQLLNSPISDYDFKTILAQIHSEIKTQKIILVGYSQGSFYTNEIYNYLVKNGIPKESIAVYNIATPANYVAGSGEYLTSHNDKVINQARNIASKIKAPQPLPGNINIPLSEIEKKDSLGGHLFRKSYLKNAFSDITSGIQKEIENLNSTNEILKKNNPGCFNLPDQNFIYKTQGVLFAVADPISNGTTFVAKTGYNSAVYMKNSTVDGIVVTASAIDSARKALAKDIVFIADLTTKAAIATGKTISNVAIVAADFTATTIVSNGKTMTDVVVLATQKIVNQTTKLVANTNEKMVSQITDKSQEKNQEMQKNLMFGSSTSITSKQTTLGKVEPQEIKKPQEKEMQEKEMSQEMPKQENQLMTNQTQNLNDKKENEIKKQENQLMTNDKFPMTNQTQNPNDKKENEIKKQKVLKPKFLEPKALALNLAPIINSTPVLASDSKPKFIESKIPMPISKPIPTPILKPIPTSISKPILTPILESKPDSNLIPTQNLITKNEPQYPLTPHAPSFFSTPSTSSYSYFSAPTIVELNTLLPKILISEICAGLKNSETKYIELYNPNDEEIILNDNNFQLKFFDSENQTTIKNIQWIKNKISPKGYFLLGTTSTLDDLSVDATYLDSSENISGVVISDGQNNIKDQLSWAKMSPSENVEANFFITKEDFKINQSIERKLIDAKNDATDFSLISILTPINSLNEKKVYDFQAPETILEKSPDTTTNLTTAFFRFLRMNKM